MTVQDRRAVAAWLLICAALVYAMVVVGGVTRLTHSGLSMVEWQPLVGAMPPLSHADWQELFEKYRQTPEFRLVGRTIGLAFLLPFLYFLFSRKLEKRVVWQLAGVFVLGALQGALGWYM